VLTVWESLGSSVLRHAPSGTTAFRRDTRGIAEDIVAELDASTAAQGRATAAEGLCLPPRPDSKLDRSPPWVALDGLFARSEMRLPPDRREPPTLPASGKPSKGWIVTPTIIFAIEQGTAERVARTGGQLAQDLGAGVVLVHVREDPPLFNSKPETERARNRARRRGQKILQRAYDVLPRGVHAHRRVELGVAANQLSEIASELDVALIVVGTRGRGRLASALLGSISQTLARKAPCPVMIVPDRASVGSPAPPPDSRRERSTIIAGVDGSDHSSAAAGFARKLADSLGDRLVIVPSHAIAEPPAHALQAVAARESARLIVLGADHGDNLRYPLSGSVAGQLPRLAPCPVIVLPEGATGTMDAAGETDARRPVGLAALRERKPERGRRWRSSASWR
jgi:nucleotide-binding universal stress UspA family protein